MPKNSIFEKQTAADSVKNLEDMITFLLRDDGAILSDGYDEEERYYLIERALKNLPENEVTKVLSAIESQENFRQSSSMNQANVLMSLFARRSEETCCTKKRRDMSADAQLYCAQILPYLG